MSRRLAKALLRVDVLGGAMYWSHGGDCPQRYRIDEQSGCTCGVAEAQAALAEIADAADLGLTGKSFDTVEEFLAFLEVA